MQLSLDTKRCVDILFPESEREEVVQLLVQECGNNLPFLENQNEEGLERFRFAALKLSGGNLRKLKDAVQLAKTDWRDLLVSAEFAEHINAHRHWFSTKIDI